MADMKKKYDNLLIINLYPKMILHNCSHVIKGQLVNEDHLTFVDSNGKYLDHTAISDKKAITQHGKLMDVLEKYDSTQTLEILKTDGENANSGLSGTVWTVNEVLGK